mmetsp:Transcript_51698/g.129734  ORF Transcript_51698/g.129734 Transcript_51698/m.129734 type:complete len:200 (-) Transcript_51698:134-733(-)
MLAAEQHSVCVHRLHVVVDELTHHGQALPKAVVHVYNLLGVRALGGVFYGRVEGQDQRHGRGDVQQVVAGSQARRDDGQEAPAHSQVEAYAPHQVEGRREHAPFIRRDCRGAHGPKQLDVRKDVLVRIELERDSVQGRELRGCALAIVCLHTPLHAQQQRRAVQPNGEVDGVLGVKAEVRLVKRQQLQQQGILRRGQLK